MHISGHLTSIDALETDGRDFNTKFDGRVKGVKGIVGPCGSLPVAAAHTP